VAFSAAQKLTVARLNALLPGAWQQVNGGVGFAAGWSDFGAGYRPVKYRINENGDVEFDGAATNGASVTSPSTIFTLPSGYRPSANVAISLTLAATTAAARFLNVAPTGVVDVRGWAGSAVTGPLHLTGLRFALTA
jgi:hypothetical protein